MINFYHFSKELRIYKQKNDVMAKQELKIFVESRLHNVNIL